MVEQTNEANERQIYQATQLTRVNNALSFLAEANTARNQHLANFQGNADLWAASYQNRVATLENNSGKQGQKSNVSRPESHYLRATSASRTTRMEKPHPADQHQCDTGVVS